MKTLTPTDAQDVADLDVLELEPHVLPREIHRAKRALMGETFETREEALAAVAGIARRGR